MNKIQIPWEERPVGCNVALLAKSGHRTLSYSFIQ